MTLSNLSSALFDNDFSVYYLLLFTCILVTLIAFITRFSEIKVINSGIFLFIGCLSVNFVISFYSETYWCFILHWLLASISFFFFWYFVIYICENYGQPYSGDGGLVMLLPVYFLFFALLSSMLIKGVIKLIQLF